MSKLDKIVSRIQKNGQGKSQMKSPWADRAEGAADEVAVMRARGHFVLEQEARRTLDECAAQIPFRSYALRRAYVRTLLRERGIE